METVEVPPETADMKKPPDFEARMAVPGAPDLTLVFDDLCTVCRDILTKGLEAFMKVSKVSAKRTAKKKDAETVAAPDAAKENATPAPARNHKPPPLQAPRG